MKKTKKVRMCYRLDVKAIITSFDAVINHIKTSKNEDECPTLLYEVEYDKKEQPIAVIFKIPFHSLHDSFVVYDIINEHSNKSRKLITIKYETYK